MEELLKKLIEMPLDFSKLGLDCSGSIENFTWKRNFGNREIWIVWRSMPEIGLLGQEEDVLD